MNISDFTPLELKYFTKYETVWKVKILKEISIFEYYIVMNLLLKMICPFLKIRKTYVGNIFCRLSFKRRFSRHDIFQYVKILIFKTFYKELVSVFTYKYQI